MAIIDFNSVSGVSTVTATSSIRVGSGVTITSTSIVGVSTVGVTTIFVGTGASISSPATNVLTLGTNNSESVRINSSGNFGLGTNDPQVRLDVRQDSSSTTTMAGIRVQNTNITGDSQSGISFFNYDNFGAKIYTLRTGSPQGVLVFATNNGNGIAESNVIERLRIDSSGRVTMPYQPSFFAYVTGGDTTTANDTIIVFGTTAHNTGSHYSTSTGRFTAPVTGVYAFHAQIWAKNGTGFSRAIFRVAGTQVTQNGFHPGTVSNSNDHSFQMSMVRYVAAGDAVDVMVNLGPLTYYGGGAQSHTYFCGHLVG